MKISLKLVTIAALSGVILCAAMVPTSANRITPVDNAYENDMAPLSASDGYAATETADIENDIFDDVNVCYVEVSDLTYYVMSDGKEVPVLWKYIEECRPYIDEMLRIDEECGIENIPDFTTKEAIDRILSMSVEEFRDYLCGETVETVFSDLSGTAVNGRGRIVAPDGTVYSGDEIVFLTKDEYPDEIMPYVEELQRINEEFGTEFGFAILDFMVDECIDLYSSMTIDEFREFVFNAFPLDIVSATLVNKSEAGQDTHYYADGEKPVFLTEYPEVFLPYAEELERINAELGTDYTFGIKVSSAEEIIAFYTSMTIDEFRDYIYDTYKNDILAGRIIMAESTGEATDPGLGVYHGSAQLYPCD